MKCVAGVDLGTQSMKVVLYDYENKKTVESGSCPMDLISKDDGTREQTTEMYEKGLDVCFSKLSAEGKASIQAIGVSGQQHGFVPLGEDGKALYNIKLWNDTSTAEECKLLTDALGGKEKVVEAVQNFMQTPQARRFCQAKVHHASARLFEFCLHQKLRYGIWRRLWHRAF